MNLAAHAWSMSVGISISLFAIIRLMEARCGGYDLCAGPALVGLLSFYSNRLLVYLKAFTTAGNAK